MRVLEERVLAIGQENNIVKNVAEIVATKSRRKAIWISIFFNSFLIFFCFILLFYFNYFFALLTFPLNHVPEWIIIENIDFPQNKNKINITINCFNKYFELQTVLATQAKYPQALYSFLHSKQAQYPWHLQTSCIHQWEISRMYLSSGSTHNPACTDSISFHYRNKVWQKLSSHPKFFVKKVLGIFVVASTIVTLFASISGGLKPGTAQSPLLNSNPAWQATHW